ncbi:transmembrane protein 18, partial [Ochromonadaceae sp. CCMP2298]
FSSAIDWAETWIRCLLGLHVALFLLVLLTRNHVNAQTALFLLICLLVFAAERLNSYCAVNWPLFAKQNYFDAHGVFASTMFAGPLLIILLIQLINFLRLAATQLIKVKRMELKKTRREDRAA